MKLTRRRFLVGIAITGGGLLIGYSATRPSRHSRANAEFTNENQHFVTSWLRLDPDNRVTVLVPHSEMGQGVLTSLPMMAADEMDADWNLVNIEQAPAHDLFANGAVVKGFLAEFVNIPDFMNGIATASTVKLAQVMNMQITGGSSSVRYTGEEGMRVAGAAAREMLVTAAAQQWGVPTSECATRLSHVYHDATQRSLSYGELASSAALLEPPENPRLKDPSEFTIMGKSIARVDIPAKVDGSAQYGIDAHPPGMLYAAVSTSPVFGNKLISVDSSIALTLRGVEGVVELDDAVAVVADSYWRATKALKTLKIQFEKTENNNRSSDSIFSQFDNALANEKSKKDLEEGNIVDAFEDADDVLEASYRVPYLAHAAMEPMNCTVHFHDGKCDVWTSTQDNLGIRGRVASLAGLDENDVTVHRCYLGGGFGRRLPNATNTIDQATIIARKFDVPIKTVWSREDDMRQDYYRPAVTSNFRGAFKDNQLVGWENHYIGKNSPPEAAHTPYAIANKSIRYVNSDTHIPFGAWRSVAHSQHTFFTESFIDELAHRAQVNPYRFRLDRLKDKPRHARVLETAAEQSGWGQNLPAGHAMGIALQESFGSIVAQVAEVSIGESGEVRVHRVTCAIDCGRAINPDTVKAQVESGIIYGLTAALYGEISVENGAIKQGNFPDYEMLKLATSPEIDVHIIESGHAIGGLGEPATPPITAAVSNAVYILTGQRVRQLPLKNYRFSTNTPETA